MKKYFLFACFFLLFFLFVFAGTIKASIITIDKEGRVVWNVLSYESTIALGVPQDKSLHVESAVNNNPDVSEELILKKDEEKISLTVGDNSQLDVTNWQDNLIDIEERGEVKKVQISLKDKRFKIQQEQASALTDFSIKVDPKANKILVATASGEKYLAVLPYDAAQSVLRARAVSVVSKEPFELFEENKDLAYLVSGERRINLFNIAILPVAVKAKVSASTGEVISVEQPTWLKLFGFLFV